MEISQIKQQLEITQVAEQLGITINPRTKRALCPFHPDKTPSLQFSKEKQIATCFSSNCNAGTMDVIKLTQKKLQKSTHETLNYLKELTRNREKAIVTPKKTEQPDYHKDFEQMKIGFSNSSTARNYAQSRKLDRKTLTMGYNPLKNSRYNYLRGCIIFPLKNKSGNVVSLYGRSVTNQDNSRHYYTANRSGLYPHYPKAETKTLILTESIIDCATLMQYQSTLNIETLSFLALYGTNGLTKEHTEAVSQLNQLEEIILFLDGDAAGIQAAVNHGTTLKTLLPNACAEQGRSIQISVVNTLENEDINSLLIGHSEQIFTQLLEERTSFFLSTEVKQQACIEQSRNDTKKSSTEVKNNQQISTISNQLITSNPNNITYPTDPSTGSGATYYIKGGIRRDLDSLKVTLVIEQPENKAKSRNKLDLYEDKQTEKISREAAEKLNLRADLIEQDLNILTDLLDSYREESLPNPSEGGALASSQKMLTPAEKEKCFAFLKKPKLLENINELIGKSGVVGEEKSRIFLFGIAATYKMENTLHALIQGTSGSGKTHLLATIMDFMPPEDTISLTRVTESSFYNYGEYELQNKLIGMEDFDGLEEKAELAFRELQSKGMISSSTSGKNEHTGQITGFVKKVYGPIASLSATTKGEIYEDNMSRCFLLSVDESSEQTQRIIRYQNQRAAGRINKKEEEEIREFLRNCMRLLKPLDVINPYADKIDLPSEAQKIRRLNDLFQSYVKQMTLLNQYQRQRVAGDNNTLITDKEDVKVAIEIMFDSIILKVDELDGSLRDFYEKLKKYILAKGAAYEFEQREIRQNFRMSKTQMHRNINSLLELEYIAKTYVSVRNTFHYKISYWDNMEALRNRIKNDLNEQLKSL